MHCVHCGRQLFRDPAATVTTRSGALHWGPKCAAKAGIRMEPLRKGRTAKPQRATDHSAQADWIDNLNTPQPDMTGGLEPRATP